MDDESWGHLYSALKPGADGRGCFRGEAGLRALCVGGGRREWVWRAELPEGAAQWLDPACLVKKRALACKETSVWIAGGIDVFTHAIYNVGEAGPTFPTCLLQNTLIRRITGKISPAPPPPQQTSCKLFILPLGHMPVQTGWGTTRRRPGLFAH